ncbi:TonB family protein [Mucilaginibacter myungsuensis]|uniref:TonB family protein n=1 Tax=Mucilaginibacter myungsuensis TaxID=649104 RepID=A0A929KTU6_9SPHI|nr:TonB family protein [Mucilaginibacter myungsuensis]MBE9661434.1 TonB family protein [Mucilaginibacter myungsuensis]MDN3597577.1 TonB family protein [Mucilaginibacter myungsuensis]
MTWWHYLLLANVYLTLFFVFYAMFLRKETFFNLNRVYLVSSAILSFLIPLIQSSWIKSLFITHQVQQTIFEVGPAMISTIQAHATPANQITMGQVLTGVYFAGIIFLGLRFFYQLAVINYAISKPQADRSFSFFNQIRIEEQDSDNLAINAHEEVHARQWHSVDILLLEAIMILNWFNPVVYLYRNAVKYIHEFIADRDAIASGTNKGEYAMLLVSQTFVTPPHRLINPFFNSSLLKQRLQMMHKNRSHWMMLVKYGLSAPLFALMLVLSSATVDQSRTIQAIDKTANKMFATPAVEGFTGMSEDDQNDLRAVIRRHAAAVKQVAVKLPAPQVDVKVGGLMQQNASFPGGENAFYEYLSDHIKYPTLARQKNVQGKVFCTFIVETDGSITGIKVLRGIGSGADEEAVRVLATMPKWEPGVQNGHVTRQRYTVPLSFNLLERSTEIKENFAHFKTPVVKDTATRIIARVRDTSKMEGSYAKPTGGENYGYVDGVVKPVTVKRLDAAKDKLIKNFYSEKLTSGVVLMVTKHKPFFATEELGF